MLVLFEGKKLAQIDSASPVFETTSSTVKNGDSFKAPGDRDHFVERVMSAGSSTAVLNLLGSGEIVLSFLTANLFSFRDSRISSLFLRGEQVAR